MRAGTANGHAGALNSGTVNIEDAVAVERKPVVVVGLARSGVAAALFLASRGEAVVATDRKGEGELQEEVVKLEGGGGDARARRP